MKRCSATISGLLSLPLIAAQLAFAAPAAHAARQASEATLRYELRQHYQYSWSSDITTTQFNQNEEGVTNSQSQSHFSAVADLVPVQRQEDGSYIVQAALYKAQMTSDGDDGKTEEGIAEEAARQLAQPFYFTQSASGQISYVVFAAKESPEVTNIKRGFASQLQQQLTAGGQRLAATELDVSGVYTPSYAQKATEGGTLIIKERGRDSYQELADPQVRENNMDLQQRSEAVFDAKRGVVTAVSVSEHMASLVHDESNAYTGEGNAPWTEADSTSKVNLEVISAGEGEVLPEISPSAGPAEVEASIERALETDYALGSLVAEVSKEEHELGQAAPSLAAALTALDAAPHDSALIVQLRATLRQPAAFAELSGRLSAGKVAPASYAAIAAALSGLDSAAAQSLLTQYLVRDERIASATRADAMLSILLLRHPGAELVGALQTVAADSKHPLAEQSTLVLGGLANTLLRTDPALAARITAGLVAALGATKSPDRQELLIDALGNAGDPATLDALTPFLSAKAPTVRLAAIDALRKMPADLLAQRGISAAPAAERPAITYWSWTRNVGGNDVFGTLYANIEGDTVNNQMTLQANGGVNMTAFGRTFQALRALALTDVQNNNGTLQRRFLAELYVLNNRVRSYSQVVNCGQNITGTLIDYNPLLLAFSAHFYPAGLDVAVTVEVRGHLKIDYQYGYSACSNPIRASAGLTPSASITVVGEASLSLWVIRGGVGLNVTLLNTRLPITINGELNVVTGAFQICANATVTMTPVSGYLYFWYDTRNWRWQWVRRGQWNAWSFSSPSYSSTLINRCWP